MFRLLVPLQTRVKRVKKDSHMAVGQNRWYHFGVGAPFSGDWDVHWGYGIWTHGHTRNISNPEYLSSPQPSGTGAEVQRVQAPGLRELPPDAALPAAWLAALRACRREGPRARGREGAGVRWRQSLRFLRWLPDNLSSAYFTASSPGGHNDLTKIKGSLLGDPILNSAFGL